MTRALGIALVVAATLAVISVGFLVFHKPSPLRRREPSPAVQAAAPRVPLLAGETAERAVVLKARQSDPDRAAFTDRALAEKLGARPFAWRFVEVWVVNRGEGDLVSLEAVPTAALAGGAAVRLVPLADISPPEGRSGAAAMLIADLSPDPSRPLRKGAFRRTVYALDGAVAFRDLVSAEVDGIPLAPRETTETALETFLERPRPDLIAALAPEEPK
jgi:hypothetical protein